jgi:hypothetical protein
MRLPIREIAGRLHHHDHPGSEGLTFSRSNTEWDEVDMWFTDDGSELIYISNVPAASARGTSITPTNRMSPGAIFAAVVLRYPSIFEAIDGATEMPGATLRN